MGCYWVVGLFAALRNWKTVTSKHLLNWKNHCNYSVIVPVFSKVFSQKFRQKFCRNFSIYGAFSCVFITGQKVMLLTDKRRSLKFESFREISREHKKQVPDNGVASKVQSYVKAALLRYSCVTNQFCRYYHFESWDEN